MIDLTVKTLDSQNHAFSLEDDQITVRGFKEHIAESVAVPADSQRLIYCGRVLQDEKKLNDYDVNGKVIHLVQRAPPQPGQRGNDGGQSQGQNHGSHVWRNSSRTHYQLTRTQMHGNAMYLGAMSVPAEIVEGHGLALPLFSNSLSNGRLIAARHMLERIDRLIDRLENPSRPANPSSSENSRPVLGELMQETETEQFNTEDRANNGAILAEAAAAAIVAALSAAGANNQLEIVGSIRAGGSDENAETRPVGEVNEESQPEPQQPQQPQTEQQGSSSNSDGQSNRRSSPQLPRPPQFAELLELLLDTQSRLRPHIERYCKLMRDDPSLPPGRRVEENQTFVDSVSECLHYTSHACHALSDIIVDMNQQPPRNLRCRPIIIQRSAILQHGTPIQVEAHISLHGRNANNNNGNEESGDAANSASQPESTEGNVGDSTEQQEPESAAQRPADQQPEPTQSSFGTVFNLPNNVEVLMEVSPESNLDAASGSEQAQPGENNNNNNNNNNNVGGRVRGTAGAFTWGSSPAPDFIRNLMQAVAGRMVQSGMTNTTITTRHPVTVGQQNVTSMDSGNTNAGQSTQARSNVGTHPTTATQTRSTSRPHVFHPQAHPLGVGMSIGQAFDFDPFLPCNSHHIRRASTTNSNTVTSMSQSTQTSQTTTSETRPQTQTATTSSATSNTSSTNTTASTTSQTNANNPFIVLPPQLLGSRSGQPQTSISISSHNLAESLGNLVQLFGGENVPVGIVEDDSVEDIISVADRFELMGHPLTDLTSQGSESEGNFLVDLIVVMVQNITCDHLTRLQNGQLEPICLLRRPLQEFLQYTFPNTTPEELQEQTTERLLSPFRSEFQDLVTSGEESNLTRNGSRIDIGATVEALFRRHIKDMLQFLFNNDIDGTRFCQEIVNTLNNLGTQLYAILRYSILDGQERLEVLVSRFLIKTFRGTHSVLRIWLLHNIIHQSRLYSARITQLPESEILPLLVYKDAPSQPSTAPSAPTHQPTQVQSEAEPMETETAEEGTTFEVAFEVSDDREVIPETFSGYGAVPRDWVPIIARDGVRQRRQLQMEEMTNGGVTTFSDAYLGTLPTKRRKLIEQQRLLVSPTPNRSAIVASMERLVREGFTRAGVEEVEGAAVAVAVDPGVRRAFGQAIRDCLNRRYRTPDFPDPLRFPNATKYFSDPDRSPKK